MQSIDHILRTVFRLAEFRPKQREIIEDVLEGHDVVAVMPTGAGKSLCFQLPGVALGGVTLVISPLISLMADQVDHLRRLNIPAMLLNSSQTQDQQREVWQKLRNGFAGLLYVAPERFNAPSFVGLLPRLKVKLLVVDEAHCISTWGHDFRPEYRRIAEIRKMVGDPITMAVTATATPNVRRDIAALLGLETARMHVTGFDRPNLSYSCRAFDKAREKDPALLRFLGTRKDSGIIYCSTRKAVEEIGSLLEEKFSDRPICIYHAGMDQAARARQQEKFMRSEGSWAVATNAFGMGINKPDLRFVIHYNVPGSLEAYYQEAGRAGRDGQPAICILYYCAADRRTQEFFIRNIGDNNAALGLQDIARLQRMAKNKLDAMVDFATTPRCRRRQILSYFGEEREVANCDCDVCGRGTFHRYQAAGASSGTSRIHVADNVFEREERKKTLAPGSRTMVIPAKDVAARRDSPTQERFEKLRAWRMDTAKKKKWPPYCIATDATLLDIATTNPQSTRELLKVNGLGPKKIADYGDDILALLAALPRSASQRIPSQTRLRLDGSEERNRTPAPAKSAPAVVVAQRSSSNSVLAVYEKLRTWRLDYARENGFHDIRLLKDEMLIQVARVNPKSLDELSLIDGFGTKTVQLFGEALLQVLSTL